MKITFDILNQLLSENNTIIEDASQEILWLCLKNVKYHYDIDMHSEPKQYEMILNEWVGKIQK